MDHFFFPFLIFLDTRGKYTILPSLWVCLCHSFKCRFRVGFSVHKKISVYRCCVGGNAVKKYLCSQNYYVDVVSVSCQQVEKSTRVGEVLTRVDTYTIVYMYVLKSFNILASPI